MWYEMLMVTVLPWGNVPFHSIQSCSLYTYSLVGLGLVPRSTSSCIPVIWNGSGIWIS